jgi:hypothetical protein
MIDHGPRLTQRKIAEARNKVRPRPLDQPNAIHGGVE